MTYPTPSCASRDQDDDGAGEYRKQQPPQMPPLTPAAFTAVRVTGLHPGSQVTPRVTGHAHGHRVPAGVTGPAHGHRSHPRSQVSPILDIVVEVRPRPARLSVPFLANA